LAPVFEAVRFAAVDEADAVLAVVELAAVVFAGADLASADLARVDLAAVELGGADLVAVDLAARGCANVDLAAVDLAAVDLRALDFVDFFALVALVGDGVVVDCAGANAAKAANRATGMEIEMGRKDPV
jgi:uncharacterized protein YjbI with pentapeptide repeats